MGKGKGKRAPSTRVCSPAQERRIIWIMLLCLTAPPGHPVRTRRLVRLAMELAKRRHVSELFPPPN